MNISSILNVFSVVLLTLTCVPIGTEAQTTECIHPKYDPTGALQSASSAVTSGADPTHSVWTVKYIMFKDAAPIDAMLTTPQDDFAGLSLPFEGCTTGTNPQGLCEATCVSDVNIQHFLTANPTTRANLDTRTNDDGSTETGLDIEFTFRLSVPSGIAIISHNQIIIASSTRWYALSSNVDVVVSGGVSTSAIISHVHSQEFQPSVTEDPHGARLEFGLTLMTGIALRVLSFTPTAETAALGVTMKTLTETVVTDTKHMTSTLVAIEPTVTTDPDRFCVFPPATLRFNVDAVDSTDGGSRDTFSVEFELKSEFAYTESECIRTSQFDRVEPKLAGTPANLIVASDLVNLHFIATAEAIIGDTRTQVPQRITSVAILFPTGTTRPGSAALGDARTLRHEDGTLTDLARALDYTETVPFTNFELEHKATITLNSARLLRNNLIPAGVNLGSIGVYLVIGMQANTFGLDTSASRRLFQSWAVPVGPRHLSDGASSTESGYFHSSIATITHFEGETLEEPTDARNPGTAPITDEGSSGTNLAMIIGIAVGGVALLTMTAFAAITFNRSRTSATAAPANAAPANAAPANAAPANAAPANAAHATMQVMNPVRHPERVQPH